MAKQSKSKHRSVNTTPTAVPVVKQATVSGQNHGKIVFGRIQSRLLVCCGRPKKNRHACRNFLRGTRGSFVFPALG